MTNGGTKNSGKKAFKKLTAYDRKKKKSTVKLGSIMYNPFIEININIIPNRDDGKPILCNLKK
jgi:hypothetical protein